VTALELGRRLAAGELDAVSVCEEALGRAHAASAVFLTVTEERARREAAASARRLGAGAPLGPLDGVPVAWKDLVDLAGTPTTAASALRRSARTATVDAPVVAGLAAAGMVCIGKTNLSELAYSGLGLNPHFGTPPNPRDPARAPGGSSSGSAVAVAAGIVPCAIGTDTAGSVRVPAAFCGIAGFKPSARRIDRTGLLPLAETVDSIGPLATSVADLVAIDAALRGRVSDRAELVSGDEPLRLVVPAGDLVDHVDPLVAARFAAALDALAAAGAVVERRPVAAIEDARALLAEHGSLVAHEAWRVHAALLDGPDAERIDRRVLRRLREGRALPAAGYEALLRERPRVQAALAAELDGALAVLPTAPHVAPEIAPLEADDDHFMAVNTRTLRATLATSFLDMPGVSLPMGAAEHGMPAGLLLTGPSGGDDRVLAAALAVEAALAPAARAR
jgi:aspartyl-tRNA(Asn)/glutamyl-tRNA(Gln) amidotransferase subunit A